MRTQQGKQHARHAFLLVIKKLNDHQQGNRRLSLVLPTRPRPRRLEAAGAAIQRAGAIASAPPFVPRGAVDERSWQRDPGLPLWILARDKYKNLPPFFWGFPTHPAGTTPTKMVVFHVPGHVLPKCCLCGEPCHDPCLCRAWFSG